MPQIGVFLNPPQGSVNSSTIKKLLNGYTGYTGRGVTVAVLDSGVDDTHPSLKGKVLSKTDATGHNNPNDLYGHGTHVASIIAGSKISTRYGTLEGMAPDVKIVSIKVFDDKGSGKSEWIARGLREALRHNVDLVNISGGGYTGTREEKAAVDALTKNNIMVVAAIGNEGTGNPNFPAALPNAIAVGTTSNGIKAGFSSTGPSNYGVIKPDIMAPGIDVVSAATGELDGWYDKQKDGIEPMSGTSVSTPYITGALAQITEAAQRRLSRQEVEKILMISGQHNKNNYEGYGILDVGKAINSLNNLQQIQVPENRATLQLLPALATIALGAGLIWYSTK